MGRVILAIAPHIVAQAIMALFLAHENFVAEEMRISAVAMDDLSEDSAANHRGHKQFVLSEATVLHEHHGSSRFLLCTNHTPEAFDGVRAADFQRNGHAAPHSFQSDFGMVLPCGGDIHAVQRFFFEHFPIIGIAVCRFPLFSPDIRNSFAHAILVTVADCDNLHVLHAEQNFAGDRRPSFPVPDNAHSEFHCMPPFKTSGLKTSGLCPEPRLKPS